VRLRPGGEAALALAPAALGHSKPVPAPKALNCLMIECPAFLRALLYAGRNPVVDGSWRSGAARPARTQQANCSLSPSTCCG
jgi:hypothetical protein